jgi:acetyl-CoA carboxylase biotin carboxyl carrier protein
MDLDQLKQILDLVRQHNLSELELEHDGLRLKIRTGVPADLEPASTPVAGSPPAAAPHAALSGAAGPALATADNAAADISPAEEEIELAVVKSPIVGTFYRSSEPEAPSFVEIGSVVKKGQVLCIIEAMKLMNEIDSEYDGEVVNVYVENGQPVQYGERLFAIRTT